MHVQQLLHVQLRKAHLHLQVQASLSRVGLSRVFLSRVGSSRVVILLPGFLSLLNLLARVFLSRGALFVVCQYPVIGFAMA